MGSIGRRSLRVGGPRKCVVDAQKNRVITEIVKAV
jgi:hypothetical protein